MVAEECVFDRHQPWCSINLFDTHQKYADVINLQEALNYLSARQSGGDRTQATLMWIGCPYPPVDMSD
jgi:hypothetical protein